jgi:hypothetical protein
MRLEITRIEGLRNDLLLRIDRAEIESVRLSVANRDRLMTLPGMPRHRPASAEEAQGIADAKVPIEEHLRLLGVVDESGRARQRAIAISNRNLGTNHGHVAWQRGETPPVVRIGEDPHGGWPRSCLTVRGRGRLSIETLTFDVREHRIHAVDGDQDVSDEVEWATYGQQVLRNGSVTRVEDIIDEFYDLRHVLAFDHRHEQGERIRQEIYDGYPGQFRDRALRAWRENGVPRARYFHNAVGLSAGEVIVLQREGTIEEIAAALRDAGADNGLILDNGGSVACWVWWANNYAGGLVSPTIDYRPPATSAIAFVLKGPLNVNLPGGSVSYSTA